MSRGTKKDCKSATTRATITTGLRPANFPSLRKGTKTPKSQYDQVHRLVRSIFTCEAAVPAKLSNLVPTFLWGLVLLKILRGETSMRRIFSTRKGVCAEYAQSMRRVCAEYAQIFFPGNAAGIPGTLASLGYLGSAAGIPWSQ